MAKQKRIWMVLTLAVACLLTSPARAAENGEITFAQMVDGLDPVSNTELAIRTFWKEWYGRQVTWTGRVVEVKVGRTRQEIYLINEARSAYRGYNLVLSISDYNRVALLKKGQTVQFTGSLRRYIARRGRPVVVTLERGALVGVSDPEAVPEAPPASKPERVAPPPVPSEPLDFGPFVALIDPNVQTELAARTNWSNLKGKQVTWSGTVVDVKAGRGRAEVYVANDASPLYRGYNIIVKTYDVQKAAVLKKGGTVQFSGLPNRYNFRRGVPVVVTLSHGQILAH